MVVRWGRGGVANIVSAGLRRIGLKNVDAADAARDAGNWAEAVRLYSDYLKQKPHRTAIWVQLGNCLKECGELEEARDAYDKSIVLSETADAQLQLGHVLKMLGLFEDAERAYTRSLELKPSNNPALGEVLNSADRFDLDAKGSAAFDVAPRPPGRLVFLDVTDLVAYVRVNDSLSGIQRVVANLILHSETIDPTWGATLVPILPNYSSGVILSVDRMRVVHLLQTVEARSARDVIDEALVSLLQSRRQVVAETADIFVIAGAFWIFQRYDLLNALRFKGVEVAVFIHDLIQITDPDYVEPAATEVFKRSFVDVLYTCSLILTNSQFVASEVRTFLAERMTFTLPVQAVTLATELGERIQSKPLEVTREIAALARTDYVLMVSTIEIRKNHRYAVDIWERLQKRFGDHVPALVFVGKWGWQIEELRRYLKRSRNLQGLLHIFNGITDAELAFLYQHCLFTFYPSFAEGWGLPVGESLSYGKPCIASRTTAIPEVGGDLCKYVDPFDVDDGYAVVTATLADRQALADWTRSVERDFKPKKWEVFVRDFYQALIDPNGTRSPPAHHNNLVIGPSQIASFGNVAVADGYSQAGKMLNARMTRMRGWHGLEPWGCWASAPSADLLIRTDMNQVVDVTVFALLCGPSAEKPVGVSLRVGDEMPTPARPLGATATWASASGRSEGDGSIRLDLITHAEDGDDEPSNYAGIVSLAFVPTSDLAARRRLIEAIVPGALPE